MIPILMENHSRKLQWNDFDALTIDRAYYIKYILHHFGYRYYMNDKHIPLVSQ